MSKSTGNFMTLENAIAKYSADGKFFVDAIRLSLAAFVIVFLASFQNKVFILQALDNNEGQAA